jgi:hypothetical protein
LSRPVPCRPTPIVTTGELLFRIRVAVDGDLKVSVAG